VKLKIMLAMAGLAALAISGSATAGNGDKVTGGGQILVGSNAGSTIAFNGQGTTTDAKGQVQFIDRSGGKGQDQVKHHGVVDCVEVDGPYGILGGFEKVKGKLTANRFTLRVVDGGEPNLGVDMIAYTPENDDFRCGDPNASNDQPTTALGRGNAQVRDGDATNPPQQQSSSVRSSALSVIGL
jgi:hypothetical protein